MEPGEEAGKASVRVRPNTVRDDDGQPSPSEMSRIALAVRRVAVLAYHRLILDRRRLPMMHQPAHPATRRQRGEHAVRLGPREIVDIDQDRHQRIITRTPQSGNSARSPRRTECRDLGTGVSSKRIRDRTSRCPTSPGRPALPNIGRTLFGARAAGRQRIAGTMCPTRPTRNHVSPGGEEVVVRSVVLARLGTLEPHTEPSRYVRTNTSEQRACLQLFARSIALAGAATGEYRSVQAAIEQAVAGR